MTATGHAILGTVIAAKVGNPALAIPLAIASHVIADSFPHWDTGTNGTKKDRNKIFVNTFFDVMIGFILSFLIIVFLFPETNLIYAFLIIIFAQSFDWVMALYYFFDIKYFKWSYTLQKKFDNCLDKPWGIIGQASVILLIILLAKIF